MCGRAYRYCSSGILNANVFGSNALFFFFLAQDFCTCGQIREFQ
jgi:hypothetical protein